MHGRHFLTDAELVVASHNLAQAKASLACEGIYLTTEEESLFERFEQQRLSHEERRRQLMAFSRSKRMAKVRDAE